MHVVHECMCMCTLMREHEEQRDPGEMATLCQVNTTYPHSFACPPRQPGCTQSSRGRNRSPHY